MGLESEELIGCEMCSLSLCLIEGESFREGLLGRMKKARWAGEEEGR